MDDRPRQGLKWTKVLGWILSLAAFAFVGKWLWELDRNVWSELGHLRIGFLALAVLLFLGWFVTRFLAWRMISQRHGFQPGATWNIRMWTLSEFMRYIPGNVWSLAARWRGSIQAGVSRVGATQSLVIEALGLIGGAVLLVSLFMQPTWWWVGIAAIMLYAWLMPRLLPLISRKFRLEEGKHISSIELLLLTVLYAGSWTLFGLAHAAVYYSFPDPPAVLIVHVMAYSVFAWLLGYLSLVTPMGLGVREVALTGLLRSTQSMSLSFASLITVISRFWLMVSELVFVGLVLVFSRKK